MTLSVCLEKKKIFMYLLYKHSNTQTDTYSVHTLTHLYLKKVHKIFALLSFSRVID